LVAVLTDAIGMWGTVLKQRHLLLSESVRIHLDEVETLSSFIELEAVAPADSDRAARVKTDGRRQAGWRS
jgi:adenylate cyclase class 2